MKFGFVRAQNLWCERAARSNRSRINHTLERPRLDAQLVDRLTGSDQMPEASIEIMTHPRPLGESGKPNDGMPKKSIKEIVTGGPMNKVFYTISYSIQNTKSRYGCATACQS
jgi:hypothetical protein